MITVTENAKKYLDQVRNDDYVTLGVKGGGFHNFHAEQSHYKNCRRVLVWTLYLNDIPEGEGETEFLYEKIRVQPKKGLGLVFPAGWQWQHRGNPVHTTSKYISTGWWLYPPEGKMD